jgi:hypothetical protein
MRKIITLFIAAILQISLLVSLSISAEQPKSKNRPKATPKKEEPTVSTAPQSVPTANYLSVSFDPDTQRIPFPFRGHDIEQIYRTLENRKKTEQKDEFESTEQYRERLAKQTNMPLFGSVNQDALFAFVENSKINYDADTQTMTVTLHTSDMRGLPRIDKDRLAMLIRFGEMKKEKTMSQNAYGAKAEIEKTSVQQFELAIHNHSNFETERVLPEYKRGWTIHREMIESEKETRFVQRFKVPSDQARSAKDKIGTLILVKLTSPYTTYGSLFKQATFKDPSEFFSQIYYLDVDLQQIWVYDKTTGEIIAKDQRQIKIT